ncbi:MAG: carbohydrate ABC transporter substrate-binding protein [Bacillota bacterium]|nr:carbohydrate ABC transporter substrate-binding protein [Bacillota bacterium]
MKRILYLGLALVLVLSLAACSNTEKAPEENQEAGTSTPVEENKNEAGTEASDLDFAGKTLRVAGLDGGYGTEGWMKVIEGFEKLTGAKVEAQFEKNIYEVIRPEIQAGNAPDVIYNSLNQETALTETMIKEEMVMDITDVLSMKVPGEEQTVGEKIAPGFTDTAVTNPYGDGKTYLAPLFYSPTGLWYNQAMFKEAGGKYDLPQTMDEFLALGEEAKKDGIALFTYPTAGYFDTFTFAMIYEVGGPELFEKLMNYDADAWANEATPIFQNFASILDYVHPNTVAQANNESFTQNQLAVMKNEALFMPNGTWIVGEMADAQGVAEGFKWGFMPLPSIDGSDRYAYSWFEQAFISKDTKEADLAKAFIAYLYSDEATKAFIENGGAVQPIVGAEDLIEDEDSKLFFSIYSDGAKAAMGGWAAAPAVEGVSIADSLFEAVNSVANGDMTVEEWQAGVVEAATKISQAIEAQ